MFNTPFVLSFALLLSFPLLFLFAPRILPSKHVVISLPDELDELALLRRLPPRRRRRDHRLPRRHHQPQPKIAFLFLTNTNLHVAPVSQLFFQNNSNEPLHNIYIHADPTSAVAPPCGVFTGRFISSRKTRLCPPRRSSPPPAASSPPPSSTTRSIPISPSSLSTASLCTPSNTRTTFSSSSNPYPTQCTAASSRYYPISPNYNAQVSSVSQLMLQPSYWISFLNYEPIVVTSAASNTFTS